MKKIILFFVLLASTFCFSQGTDVILPISTSKTELFLQEIFKNCPDFTPTDIENYKELVDQVTIIISTKSEQELAQLPLLSLVPLKSKCNTELIQDNSNFEIGTFNPIKYFFNFYSTIDKYYRVDGTSFIIKVRAI
ncbi:MAG: hypothetical protein ACK5B9_14880 [Flavobacteriia bacterium]|jgi:hypothetical protein